MDQRGPKRAYAKQEKAFKRKMREEHQASGIRPEIFEVCQGLETIIEMTESTQIEMSDIQEIRQKQLT